MNLFGRKRQAAAKQTNDPAQTIMKLRTTVETLEKRQVHLDKQVEKQTAEAKAKMGKKDKRGALYCLKRKKMYEAEIEKINGADGLAPRRDSRTIRRGATIPSRARGRSIHAVAAVAPRAGDAVVGSSAGSGRDRAAIERAPAEYPRLRPRRRRDPSADSPRLGATPREDPRSAGARLTLEQQIIAIEGTVTNAETVNAMKSGAQAMQHARQDVDADVVGDLMDDIKEEMEVANEISEAISAPANDVLNDDDLLNELNELEELELESQLLDAPPIPVAPLPLAPTPAMPEAPTTLPTPPAQEDADMAALRELEAAMAM